MRLRLLLLTSEQCGCLWPSRSLRSSKRSPGWLIANQATVGRRVHQCGRRSSRPAVGAEPGRSAVDQCQDDKSRVQNALSCRHESVDGTSEHVRSRCCPAFHSCSRYQAAYRQERSTRRSRPVRFRNPPALELADLHSMRRQAATRTGVNIWRSVGWPASRSATSQCAAA